MDLSTEARAMLLGVFLNPKSTLTFQNVESVPSPLARKGLDDLIAAGLVARKVSGIAETFTLTDAGADFDRRSLAKNPMAWMKERGSFPLSVPKVTPGRRQA